MTDGDMKQEDAAKLQTFTGRQACEHALTYDGKRLPPKCDPMCDACLSKWLDNLE